MERLVFCLVFAVALGGLLYSLGRIAVFFRLMKPHPVRDWGARIARMLSVAIAQSKILRWRIVGIAHALVFWGFIVISVGSLEMIVDGVSGAERCFARFGWIYDFVTASGDIFAGVVLLMVLVFAARRTVLRTVRFEGPEMQRKSHLDALLALSLIALLMISLLGMNIFYQLVKPADFSGVYPVSGILAGYISVPADTAHFLERLCWWTHILLILAFANILPYSKHFHIFTSIPNVFFARLEPPAKLQTMASITQEVRLMLDPGAAAPADVAPSRFGIKDVTDGTWHNYLNSLACTECGRCVSVCPANITGKLLSPRKLFMDFRARTKEVGTADLAKDERSSRELLRGYISEEELWACTTCGACVQECPVDIHQPSLIVDMRRYLALEEGAVPSGIKTVFANIENNGAPWQFAAQDRMNWAKDLSITSLEDGVPFTKPVSVPLMSERRARGETPEYLYWVGCAGAFDDRARKIARAFASLLDHCGVDYAVLGSEESCTGDAARRAGNEMLYQMQALNNIKLLKEYGVTKILTTCPHCYNSFANEYPDLGGNYQVLHHSQLLRDLLRAGRLKLPTGSFSDKLVSYHDPCYLGRANGEYDAARELLEAVAPMRRELRRNKSFSLCCGAGGAQIFKEAEPGKKEVFMERMDDVLEAKADIVATGCPFCKTMLSDGSKYSGVEETVRVADIAELLLEAVERGRPVRT
jgi:Fe-S oxidoreductase